MVKAAGIADVREVDNESDLASEMDAMKSGVLVVKVEPGNAGSPIIELTPEEIRDRFMGKCKVH